MQLSINEELSEINIEIAEYTMMIDRSIQTNEREFLSMWRRALQTAKVRKRKIKRRLVEIS
ncbi:MAG: hypothetical protein N4A40_12555 [Tissierellales bacterium]|nr:hypothetical protein [Tissierellales bacterium]